MKYKLGEAFEESERERNLEEYGEEVDSWRIGSGEWYNECRRCRAKAIMVILENREEVLEDGDPREVGKSLGLKRMGAEVRCRKAISWRGSWRGRNCML